MTFQNYSEILLSGSRGEIHAFEKSLIHKVAQGDQEAFRELTEVHLERLYRVAHRIVRHDEDAADVVQEVLLTTFLKAHSFRADSQLSTWLHRVTCNAALMMVRRRRRHEPVEFEELSVFQPDAGQAYEERESLMRLRAAWPAIKPAHRQILNLRVRDELSLQEIADSLKLTVPAAKSRIHRARLELAEATN